MRAVCFVERQELDFPGTICKNALALGDVDGDGESELVVGNEAGDLAIFKKSTGSTKPWYRTSGLRMITAVGVGDLIGPGRSTLVVVSGDGWCQLLLSGPAPTCSPDTPLTPDTAMHVAHTQRIPPNTHCLVLGDIDGNGYTELVVGLTDRVVRSYRWQPDPPPMAPGHGKLVSLHKWEAASQVGGVSIGREKNGRPSVLVSQPGGTFLRIYCNTPSSGDSSTGSDDTLNEQNQNVTEEEKGSIQLHRQLFSLTRMDITGDGRDEIIVCSWDGQTYILGQDQVSVRFQFEDSVAAFCAGRYGTRVAENVHPPACLVYCTFANKIFVYTDLKLDKLRASSLDATTAQMWPDKSKSERQNGKNYASVKFWQ
ncbi:hypothetical protein B566_EDAN017235 [Ephemera danica]|nr:hypothetical protein B566_EDAN017235 [Ephemera danica]